MKAINSIAKKTSSKSFDDGAGEGRLIGSAWESFGGVSLAGR
jgi:hypothetical protein